MLTVAEARAAVLAHAWPLLPRKVRLSDALGLRLDDDVRADLDLPPFDKALVDGFAVRSDDVAAEGPRALRIVETIFAGQTPTKPIGPGEATEIMTGAPLPDGSDAVVMIEKTARPDPNHVVVTGPIAPGQNRLVRGREMTKGEVVVPAGAILDAPCLGVLASVGAAEVSAWPRPSVAIIATGDEIVDFDRSPGPGQIRNSNSVLLAAMAEQSGAVGRAWPIVRDRPDELRDAFRDALGRSDILIISGGVSAGQRDLVPAALAEAGVHPIFHKVRVKPGKPLWFGVGPRNSDGVSPLVFGLPGNPVSGLVSFLLFVRPALAILAGRDADEGSTVALPLAIPYRHADDRDVYRPARLVEGGTKVEPLTWAGSSDLRGVASGNGFAIFPAGERMYQEGVRIGFLPLDTRRIDPGLPYSS